MKEPTSSGTRAPRATEIDGIRGWASFAVLLFHLLCVVFGEQLPGLRGNPFTFAWLNGPLAVFVFFILSGDALSIGYLQTGDRRVIDSLVIRRYFRLMVPIAMSTLLIFALMRTGLVFNKPAGQIATFYGWLGGAIDFTPTWPGFLRYIVIEVFSPSVVFAAPAVVYNPMLWTMSVELAGSALVFGFWYLSPALTAPSRLLLVLATALTLLGSFYGLFFFGALLSQWRRDGHIDRWRQNAGLQVVAPLLAVMAAVFHARFQEGSPAFRHVSLVCSMLLVTCFYMSRPALQFFRSRLSRYLGEISFPLYLTHFTVIVSFTSFLIVRHAPMSPARALAISAASILLSLGIATVFRAGERRVLRRVDSGVERLLGPKSR